MSPNFRLFFIVRRLFCFAFPQQIQVAEILAEKKFRKASGTTADEEAKAPSVEVPDDFEDFSTVSAAKRYRILVYITALPAILTSIQLLLPATIIHGLHTTCK